MKLDLYFCADILSEKKYEQYILLISNLPIGTWCLVHEILDFSDDSYDGQNIFVSWSKSFDNNDEYILIIFCEEESMDMVTGKYNMKRLMHQK